MVLTSQSWENDMSTFAVFGVSKHKIMERARKKIPAVAYKNGPMLSESEWEAKVQAKVEEDFANPKARIVQISEKFDAPQFCAQFMKMCDSENFRNLEVRWKAPAKKGGQKTPAWTPYDMATGR